jgi:hypothetical protein
VPKGFLIKHYRLLAPSLKRRGETKPDFMKKIFVAAMLFFSIASVKNAAAQVRVNVNVNIGSQPDWGPAGYNYVEYYYLPDIEAYYYVPNRQFIYLSGPNWVFSYSLPPRYRGYNLYNGYKVVVNQPFAYRYFETHRNRYSGYRGHHGQTVIRYSPVYKNKKYKPSHGNGNSRGWGRGHGRH